MSAHYLEPTDERTGHRDTASDAYVQERRDASRLATGDLIAAGAVIALLLALATAMDHLSPSDHTAHPGAHVPVPHWQGTGDAMPAHVGAPAADAREERGDSAR